MDILDRIEQSLNASLALAVDPPAHEPRPETLPVDPFVRIEERLRAFDGRLAKADHEALEASRLLNEVENAFADCLTQMKALSARS
jgi:hypothetical protein